MLASCVGCQLSTLILCKCFCRVCATVLLFSSVCETSKYYKESIIYAVSCEAVAVRLTISSIVANCQIDYFWLEFQQIIGACYDLFSFLFEQCEQIWFTGDNKFEFFVCSYKLYWFYLKKLQSKNFTADLFPWWREKWSLVSY